MKKEIIDSFNNALDQAMDEFMERPDSIFDNTKDQLIFRFAVIKELQNWKKNQNCIVKGCSSKSIKNSHTIQKSGPIKEITELGHVLSPKINGTTGDLELAKIGVNEASTFPGYCQEHENLFHGFEQNKEIKNVEDLGLQIYRTICREIVVNENHQKQIKYQLNSYKVFRNGKIKESVINKIDKNILADSSVKIKLLNLEHTDQRVKAGEESLEELRRYLTKFLYIFQEAILHDLKSKKFSKVAYVGINFDKQIPVALAGRGNFFIKLKTKKKEVEVIFNVLPSKESTFVFICTLKKYEKELKHYMGLFTHPLQFISLIENWMLHGSDHWFIKPSVWSQITPNNQTAILNEISDYSLNIGSESNLSIFNDIKNDLLNQIEESFDTASEDLKKLFFHEKKKIKLDSSPTI